MSDYFNVPVVVIVVVEALWVSKALLKRKGERYLAIIQCRVVGLKNCRIVDILLILID